MPSRPTLAVILAFWLATCGFVLYRDVWPRLTASGPPPMAVDLGEEASPNVSVRWTLYRGDKKVGRLTTHTAYVDADDTFRQTHDYRQLEFEFSGAKVVVPQLVLTTRVSRAGDLREQTAKGTLEVQFQKDTFKAEAHVQGRVVDGLFVGRCEVRSLLGDVNEELEPVAVPDGQALNPLQVTNRITGLKAGQHWVVQEIDPLGEAVATLVKGLVRKAGLPFPERKREAIFARVSSAPEVLTWHGQEERCWVIDYRGGEARAKTWVRESDGKVLRQEAFGMGERLTVDRDE
jgi:hypothetical protein